jgi:transposase-like protein
MAKQRNYSTELKRQVVLEYLAGETLYGLSKRHDVSRNVIRLWIARYEADGELNASPNTLLEGALRGRRRRGRYYLALKLGSERMNSPFAHCLWVVSTS